MRRAQLTQSIKSFAIEAGFESVGISPAIEPAHFERFDDWIEAGYHGEMEYLETRREAYRHPDHVMPQARSVVMLAMNYRSAAPPVSADGHGRIASYAWGEADYHDIIHKRLKHLCQQIRSLDESIAVRGVVDTAPLLEREFAQAAGLGWFAKNTMLIDKTIGSFFFLAAVLIDCELDYDDPHTQTHCGTCTACLDACPTDAFVGPGELDATRCISYLTIEHRSPIPVELRAGMGDWVLGCDVCQDVCPWNRKAPLSQHEVFQPLADQHPLSLIELFDLDDDQFRARFRKSPLWRPKRRGILRNAAIALGNRPAAANLPALAKGLNDTEPLIRGAAAWAMGKHAGVDANATSEMLKQRRDVETDEIVLAEIGGALTSNNL